MTAAILGLQEIHDAETRVRRTYAGESLTEGGDEYEVTGPVTLDLRVRKDGNRYWLVGRIEARLGLACCRCLEPVGCDVDVALDLRYLPMSENSGEGEVEIEEADLRTAFYRDDQIDLGALIQEQFRLALPMKPLCRGDCRGLCATCGGNRNVTDCGCVDTWEDPRLASLKRLLER